MLQQRTSQPAVALHDVCIAPDMATQTPSSLSAPPSSGPHAFNSRTDPIAVLLASHPQQAASGAHSSSAVPNAHTAILTSLALQRQGIEVQASLEVTGQAWACSIEAGRASPQQRLQSVPGIGADSVLMWQRQGPALLWGLGAGAIFALKHPCINERMHKPRSTLSSDPMSVARHDHGTAANRGIAFAMFAAFKRLCRCHMSSRA